MQVCERPRGHLLNAWRGHRHGPASPRGRLPSPRTRLHTLPAGLSGHPAYRYTCFHKGTGLAPQIHTGLSENLAKYL